MLLTFDIWDTVLRRNCHPDEVKINTSKYLMIKYKDILNPALNEVDLFRERQEVERLIGSRMKEEGFDDEYLLEDVLKEWVRSVANIKISENDLYSITDELYNIELEQEKIVSYLDDQILNELNNMNTSDKLFLSDFYTDSSFIRNILDSKGFPYTNGFTSIEKKLNKRSGRIFDFIQNELGITSEGHSHIGDNKVSDFENPNRLGIKSTHYYNAKEEHLRDKHNKRFQKRLENSDLMLREINNELLMKLNDNDSPLYQIGKRYALIYIAYILEIMEFAIGKNIDTVYFFTREGVLFKNIYEKISSKMPHYIHVPRCSLLEVSRVATFCPTLKEFTLNELMRIWNQYSIQSMEALFKSLDIEISGYKHYFEKHRINIYEEIVYPWQNELVIQLFNDEEFISSISDEVKIKRGYLEQYLKQKGISNAENESLLIVDIGWRGTIQDNLAYLLDKVNIYGYYFGLYPFINPQPSNVNKISFLSSEDMGDVRFVAPLEMLSNAPMGSIRGYKMNRDKIEAFQEDSSKERYTHEHYVSHYQKGILDSIEEWMDIINSQSWTSRELKSFSKELLVELLTMPPKELAEAYFKLAHNETFGVGKFIETKRKFPFSKAIKAVFSLKGKKEFVSFIESTSWPQGYLVYNHLNYLLKIYNEKVYFKK